MALRAIKERILPEEKIKRQARNALDIADKMVLEMKTQQLSIKKCAEYQEAMLNRLNNVMDGAVKIGNKGLYAKTAPIAHVVSQWHDVTIKMYNDENLMVEFVSMIKTFYKALLEYRKIVRDFTKTAKDFTSFKTFGVTIPQELSKISVDAAKSFDSVVNSVAEMEFNYTGLTDVLNMNGEEKWNKKFDEERNLFLNKNISKNPKS